MEEIRFFVGMLAIMAGVIFLAAELHAGFILDGGIKESDKGILAGAEYVSTLLLYFLFGAEYWQILSVSPLFPALRWYRDHALNIMIHEKFDYIGKNSFTDRFLNVMERRGYSQHFVRSIFAYIMILLCVFLYNYPF